jgi:hypothetical protein
MFLPIVFKWYPFHDGVHDAKKGETNADKIK